MPAWSDENLLALVRTEAGAAPAAAMHAVLDDTRALMSRRGVAEPLRFAAALSDGEQLLAFRDASDGHPPSLHVGGDAQGRIVASEPLDARPEDWQNVPVNAWVSVDRRGTALHATGPTGRPGRADWPPGGPPSRDILK